MATPPRVNKLREAMQGMAATPQVVPVPIAPASEDLTKAPATARPPSCRGKRVVSAYVNAAAAKQLRLLSVEHDSSTQALIEEALNDLFRKYNRSAVA